MILWDHPWSGIWYHAFWPPWHLLDLHSFWSHSCVNIVFSSVTSKLSNCFLLLEIGLINFCNYYELVAVSDAFIHILLNARILNFRCTSGSQTAIPDEDHDVATERKRVLRGSGKYDVLRLENLSKVHFVFMQFLYLNGVHFYFDRFWF